MAEAEEVFGGLAEDDGEAWCRSSMFGGVAERERESSRQEAWVDGFNQGGERQGEDVGWGAAGLLLGYGGPGVGGARRIGHGDGALGQERNLRPDDMR